jgi:hypothetical protein
MLTLNSSDICKYLGHLLDGPEPPEPSRYCGVIVDDRHDARRRFSDLSAVVDFLAVLDNDHRR